MWYRVVPALVPVPKREVNGSWYHAEQHMAYIASKTQSGRPGWSLTFRHPLRKDSRDKPGLKVRRGLGTEDPAEADRLVAQMNTLLSDESWWSASRRTEAEARFDRVIVEAFFGDLQAGRVDTRDLRNRAMPLPSAAEGYPHILFVGTTGAGKTSLLRQLIGSDPDEDRFPSTAPAKTTIADIEVIQAPGEYSAVVTFFSEFQILTQIEECILDAAYEAYQGQPAGRVAERLLNHRDQKFRLSYILGNYRTERAADPAQEEVSFDDLSFEDSVSEEVSFDHDDAAALASEDSVLTVPEQEKNQAVLNRLLERIGALSSTAAKGVADTVGVVRSEVTASDKEALDQLIEEAFEAEILGQEAFHDLAQDILGEVRQRFEYLRAGRLSPATPAWPQTWMFETADRAEFIREIRWFSSNYWPEFGRLLTPVVDGIRVKGPLYSAAGQSSLVLIDGQGLGHTPDANASVTTHITRRFSEVDVILLVDSAKQPMQAAPLSVLRAIATSGNADKVAIALTHFDQISAPSLRSHADRSAHVMRSVTSGLASLRTDVAPAALRPLESRLEKRTFLLGSVDMALGKIKSPSASRYMGAQLRAMMSLFADSLQPKSQSFARPTYETMLLSVAVRDGMEAFHTAWDARLGLTWTEGVRREHWTRVKALSRRIATEENVEYATLKPLADLVTSLGESLSWFIERPASWSEDDEELRERSVARIRQRMSASLHELAQRRIIDGQLREWRSAYAQSGPGSGRRRARIIQEILNEAAPTPRMAPSNWSQAFLQDLRDVLEGAISEVGGELQSR